MTGEPHLTLTDLVRRNTAALTAEIDGEAVALDVARGVCYGMDPVAARIWGLLESPSTIAAVCDSLTALYEVDGETCRREVLDLLEDLKAADLITVESAPPRRDD
jgi:hypothetical protein